MKIVGENTLTVWSLIIMCCINVYTDSNLILSKVYHFEKSETRKMCSAEIQERIKLSKLFSPTNEHYKMGKRLL